MQGRDTRPKFPRTTGTSSWTRRAPQAFAEKISTRAAVRPELDKAVALAREIRASGAAVTIVVHEHKRLGRGIEMAALAEQLRATGIGLEFLAGKLQGSHDPAGVVFTVLAAMAGSEREYIRERTLEGHEAARARGKVIGGAAVTDDAMLAVALHHREQGLSLRDIAARLVISAGKKKASIPRRRPSCGCSAIMTRRLPQRPPRANTRRCYESSSRPTPSGATTLRLA